MGGIRNAGGRAPAGRGYYEFGHVVCSLARPDYYTNTEMDKLKCISKLAVLLLVLMNSSLRYTAVSCDEINIIPTPDTPCPGASKGEPCFTLQQYIANHTAFSSNTTLIFYSGNHFLDTQLSVSYVDSFAMRATKTATIFCSRGFYGYRFTFLGVHTVQIRGIIFNGCRISLTITGNSAIIKSSFVNTTEYVCCNNRGGVLDVSSHSDPESSLLIKQCVFSDNIGGTGAIFDFGPNLTVDQCTFTNNYGAYWEGGAIYKNSGRVSIFNSHFSHNKDIKEGGAVSILADQATIANCSFSDNVAGGVGGAVVAFASPVVITNSYFTDNIARPNGSHGGALFAYGSNAGVIITDSYFSDNVAGPISGNGGAVHIEGAGPPNNYHRATQAINQYNGNITISGNTFEYNVASGGGGGAIYSGVRYATISLTKNTFSHNTAANCGAVQIFESWLHYNANFIGNVFTHNRATGQVAGGGGMCISKASALVSDNTFSHNTAAGDAGALQVGDCDIVTIKGSKFSNNAAQGNGGVIHAYYFSTNYTITHSSFTNNRAGGDGGVMYVESASSQVKIRKSTFSYNHAMDRGGVVAINGSTLLISGANICKENNTASLGGVVSACKSKVRISHPKIPSTPDPVHPFCNLYDC